MKNALLLILFTAFLFSCEKPQEFELKTDNRVISFSVAYFENPSVPYANLVLDNEKGEIQCRVPFVNGSELTRMKANITVPASATIEPAFTGKMDLSKPYRFSVIAENGTKKDYLLLVYY